MPRFLLLACSGLVLWATIPFLTQGGDIGTLGRLAFFVVGGFLLWRAGTTGWAYLKGVWWAAFDTGPTSLHYGRMVRLMKLKAELTQEVELIKAMGLLPDEEEALIQRAYARHLEKIDSHLQ